MPWNHELFQTRTLLDLLVEYWLDVFDEKPLEAHRNEDGFIQLRDTGDALIDKWEEQIAAGQEPDLTQAFSAEAWEKLNRLRTKSKNMKLAPHGMTMRETADRVTREANLQGLDVPSNSRSINLFGENGLD